MAAEDEQVKAAYLLRGLGEDVGGGQRVRAAEGAVGKQIALVAAERHGLFQHVRRLGRAHGDGGYRSAVRCLQLHRRLYGVQIQRIYHARNAVAAEIAGPGV